MDMVKVRSREALHRTLAVLVDVVDHSQVSIVATAPVSCVRPVSSFLMVLVRPFDDVAFVMETKPS